MLQDKAAIEECAGKVEALHAELCELLWRHCARLLPTAPTCRQRYSTEI
jgi:hypothetical protein